MSAPIRYAHASILHLLTLTLILLHLTLLPSLAVAAPAAGTSIGNQASATYSDASLVTRTVTSNAVVTIVQQVASLTLGSNGTKQAAPGGLVSYPHTVTNTGNGTDSFTLGTSVTSGFAFTSVTLYADANSDGVPDSTVPITTTGSLAAGASFSFVAVGLVPPLTSAGSTNTLTVTATSVYTPAQSASNTDTTTVSGNAIINVTKAIDVATGLAGSGPRTFTLTYTNSGTGNATAVTITDVIPSGMTYVAGSARWSVTGSTALTDADASDNQSGIVYDYNVTSATRVTAVIASVAAGASGTLTFQANINSGLAPGALAATLNIAGFSYNNGAASIPSSPTNAVQFIVIQTAALLLTGDTMTSVAQGGVASFSNTLTNTGNGTDSFDITLGTSSFPSGTTFVLYKADGVTPLVDTNGNGVPDTGPLGAGLSTTVVLKATLPVSASGAGPYSVQKIATSKADPTKTQTVNDVLNAISANSVDLTLNSTGVGAPGLGAGPEVSAVVTTAGSAGSTTRFNLYVSNGSSVADTFNLQATTDNTLATFVLPTGWSVVFRDTSEAVISNTGVINGGANKLVYADVTVPVGTSAGAVDLYFRGLSPTSGIGDALHAAVLVSTARSLSLTPNNNGQAFAGSSVVFSHTITNTGNVLEGNGSTSTVALGLTNSASGFSATLYWDKNNDGVLDAGDPVVTDLSQLTGGSNGASTAAGLAPGESATLFVKVFAPPGVATGTINTSTLTATTTGTINSVAAPSAIAVTDSTSIIAGQVFLSKLQALDAACDGTADTAFAASNITTGAIPGACIRYQITATNMGVSNVTLVVVSDGTPANTTYHITVPAATTVGSISAPASGAAGTVQATVGTLTPGQFAVITFGVRINP
ncbi:MAG: hypothetical protein QM776_17900 [Rhodocyclaceae bacterium]